MQNCCTHRPRIRLYTLSLVQTRPSHPTIAKIETAVADKKDYLVKALPKKRPLQLCNILADVRDRLQAPFSTGFMERKFTHYKVHQLECIPISTALVFSELRNKCPSLLEHFHYPENLQQPLSGSPPDFTLTFLAPAAWGPLSL